jgi:FMN phosphatase YigB (HAD superfamily)
VPGFEARIVRIAIDIDSTLHHHWPLVAAAAKRRFGVDLPYEEQLPDTAVRLSDEQLLEAVEDTHTDAAIAAARPYPQAVETVNGWHDAGHRVEIASHRAERSIAATRRWLDDIGLRYDGLYCGADKVAHGVATGAAMLIDDSPETLLRAVDAGLLAATLRHPWNEHLRDVPEIVVADDWLGLAAALAPVLAAGRGPG